MKYACHIHISREPKNTQSTKQNSVLFFAMDMSSPPHYMKLAAIIQSITIIQLKNAPKEIKMANNLYDRFMFVIFLYTGKIDKLLARKYLKFVISGNIYGHINQINIIWIDCVDTDLQLNKLA